MCAAEHLGKAEFSTLAELSEAGFGLRRPLASLLWRGSQWSRRAGDEWRRQKATWATAGPRTSVSPTSCLTVAGADFTDNPFYFLTKPRQPAGKRARSG